MWAAIKLFFSSNALAIAEKAMLVLGALGAVAAVYRAGAQAEKNDNIEEELSYAKKSLQQDSAIAGNSDVDGMRSRLSAALRRKRDA